MKEEEKTDSLLYISNIY